MFTFFSCLSMVAIAQKPPFVQLPQQHAAPAKTGEPLYVETTKYLKYAPDKAHEDKQIRYDVMDKVWLIFTSTDSNNVEAFVYDYDPVGNMIKKINLVMRQDVLDRHGYYVYKFIYTTFTYDPANTPSVSKVNHPPSMELFSETIQKIADRLDKK